MLAPALLWSAATASATPSCNTLYRVQTPDLKAQAAHDTITADLFNGRIVSIRNFKENDNKNTLFLTTIEARNPYTGELRYRDAFYKPSIWGDGDGWARAGMEYVAYALNRVLKMDYVPPTSFRYNFPVDVDGRHFDHGVLIYRVPEYTALAKLPGEKFAGPQAEYHDAVESDHRILAVLLQNGDGHHKNLGAGKHWVDGEWRPAFIDWGASLRHGTRVSLTHYPVYGNSRPVTRVREQTLQALRELHWDHFQPWIKSGFLSQDESRFILSIRDGIVQYFEGEIAAKGADAVLIRF